MGQEATRGDGQTRHCPLCGKRFADGDSCPHDGAVLVLDTVDDPMIGTVIAGAFRIDSPIDGGGMGRVYRGVQLSLQRPVAIKLLHSERSDPRSIRRFLLEARLSSKLDHPNVVRVIDGGNTSEGRCYLVMELLEGQTLEQLVGEGGLPFAEVRPLFAQLCAGVQAAHDAELLHRDLKPRNVMLVAQGEQRVLKVLDFGLAKELDPDITGLTAEGEFLGTPGYMAPEQATNESMDVRTDVYALGALLYFMLTGKRPFTGASVAKVVRAQIAGEVPQLDPEDHDGPPELSLVIARAMQPEPVDRYPSVAALLAAVEDAAAGKLAAPARPRRFGRRALILGGLAAAGVGAAAVGLSTLPFRRAPIHLGMSGPLSGPTAAIGRALEDGLRARFDLANQRGELKRRIEFELLDDGYEPARAVANVEALAGRALALVANVGTATTEASLPALLAAGMPLIGAHSGAEHLRRIPPDRYVFNYRAGYALETAALVDHFLVRERVAPEAIALLAQDDGFGDSGIEGVRRALARHGFNDFERLLISRYRANTMDVRQATQAIAGRSDIAVVIMVAAYRPAAQLVADLSQILTRPPRFAAISPAGGEVLANELRNLGQDPEGILVTQVVPHPGSAANGLIRYRQALAAADRGSPNFLSLEGFIVADMMVEALRRCPDPEREALVDTLEDFIAVDLGFGAPISFSASDHQGSERVWGTRLTSDGQVVEVQLG